MAGAREIGLGVAKVLSSQSGPNPFSLSFRGESVSEAAEIVLAVLHECADAAIQLELVELDAELFQQTTADGDLGLPVAKSDSLQSEARFTRSSLKKSGG